MKIEIRNKRDLYKAVVFVTLICVIFGNAAAYLFETTISPPFAVSDIWGTTFISATASFVASWFIFKQNYALYQKSMMLEAVNKELLQVQDELRRQANTDSLTKLPNRRCFFDNLYKEVARYERSKNVFALILVDIDHFKKVNDLFGHTVGDAVLRSFAGLLLQEMREIDVVGRTGGEEFGVLLPDTTLENATVTAERIRQHVFETPMDVGELGVSITFSAGIVTMEKDETADSLYQRADIALYRAKSAGRNRVEIA